MSFQRIRQLKQALSLCQGCVRITTKQIHASQRYTLINRHVQRRFCSSSVVSPVIKDRDEQSTITTENNLNLRVLDKLLNIVSEYATSRQRVDSRDIKAIVNILQTNKDIVLSYNDASLLLRCCGKYIPNELPSERTKLLNMVWNEIQKSGLKLSITHYNARLLAMLENDVSFLVHEELAAIDQVGIRANRTTYQIMIERLCRDGDVFVANEIKKHMEDLNMPITNIVYLNFIKAHIQSGNLEEAQNVKEIMIDAGYKVDKRAYTAMIEANGHKGDLEAITKLIAEAKENGLQLDIKEMYLGFVNLCKIGQEDKAKQLLDMMPAEGAVLHSLLNCMLEALALGCNDVALELYRKVDPAYPGRTSNAILVKQISTGTPAREIAETWNELKEMNRLSGDFDGLVLLAMRLGTPEQMLEFIEMMHEKGMPVWAHFFTPAIRRYAHEHNLEGITTAFRRMLTLSRDLLDPAKEIVFGNFDDLEHFSSDERLAALKDAGLSQKHLTIFTIYNHLASGNLKDALELCQQKLVIFPSPLMTTWLKFKVQKSGDYTTAIEILLENSKIPSKRMNTLLLGTMARDRNISISALEEALQHFIGKKMIISSDERDFKHIINDLEWKGISSKLIEQVGYLRNVEMNTNDESKETVMPQPIGVYEGPGRQNYRRNIHVDVRLLEKEAELSELCLQNKREEAIEVKTWMESQGHTLRSSSLAELCSMEVRLGNPDEATKYKNFLDMANDRFNTTFLVFQISRLLIRQNRLDEAIHLLEQHADGGKMRGIDKNTKRVSMVIHESTKINNVEATKKLVNVLTRYTPEDSLYDIVQPLVTGYLKKNDPSEMVEVLKFCKERFNVVFQFKRIMERLIELEDATNLQKVVDLVAEVIGENDTVCHLIGVLASNDRLEEALKLSQTPGIQTDNKFFSDLFSRLLADGKIEQAVKIVATAKDMTDENRDDTFFCIIKTLCRAKSRDLIKAVEMIKLYKEENRNPSHRTLRYLGNALKNEQLPIPFDVPWIQKGNEENTGSVRSRMLKQHSAQSEETSFLSLDEIIALRNTASAELTNYEQKLLASKPESTQVLMNLLLLHILQGNFQMATDLMESHRRLRRSFKVNAVMEQLYKLGDMESMEKVTNMLKHMQVTYRPERFGQSLTTCYVFLLELSVDNRDIEKCTELYKAALELNIYPTVSSAMKTLFAEYNRELPKKMKEHGEKPDTIREEQKGL